MSLKEGCVIEKTIVAYDNNADNYLQKFETYLPYVNMLKDFQDKHIANKSTVLDLGCGPGQNVHQVLSKDASCKCTGIDLSEKFLELAKLKNPSALFVLGDLRHLQLKTRYDAIIASFCIVHLQDHDTWSLLQTVSDALQGGGTLYLSFMEGEGSGFEQTSFSDDPIFFNYYDRKRVIEELENCGLTISEVREEEYPEKDGSVTVDVFIYATKQ